MPKPMQDQAGSGMHVNVSIHRDGKNLFQGDIAPDSEAGHLLPVSLRTHGADLLLQPDSQLLHTVWQLRSPKVCELEPPEP